MGTSKWGGFVALAIGLLVGCGGEPDEAVSQKVSALTSSIFTLRNYSTGYCLGVSGGNPNWGSYFVVWPCDTTANQNFQQVVLSPHVPAGFIQLENFIKANTCVDLETPSGVDANGDRAYTLGCSSPGDGWGLKQAWKPLYAGTDLAGHECYQFASDGGPDPANGKDFVLGVSGGSRSKGAAVMIWDNFQDSYNHPDQYWCVY